MTKCMSHATLSFLSHLTMFFLATLSLLLSRMRPSLAGATSPWGPIVSIQQGSYAGNDSLPGVTFFGGIPYAEPPLGNLRWRPPAKLKTYHGGKVVDARNWGPLCIQQVLDFSNNELFRNLRLIITSFSSLRSWGSVRRVSSGCRSDRSSHVQTLMEGSLDCLTLNVWKPSNARPNSKLPVVIYIHGQ